MAVEIKDLKPLFENVAKEMAQYERLMKQGRFVGREDFLAKYSGLGGASYWQDEFKKAKPASWHQGSYTSRMSVSDGVDPLDIEKAKPFIKAVVERMLDLLQSEENWVKGTEYKQTADGVDQYCLIGAKQKALKDLTLDQRQSDPEVERQRLRVCRAVEQFLAEALKEETGYSSMPSFNDKTDTTFEDVRLWLKSLFDRLG